MRTLAYEVTHAHQDVNQKCHRISFRLRFERPHDVARQPVVGSLVNRCRPFHSRWNGDLVRSVPQGAISAAYAALVAGRIPAYAAGDALDVLLRCGLLKAASVDLKQRGLDLGKLTSPRAHCAGDAHQCVMLVALRDLA